MAAKWQAIPFERLLAEPVRNGIYKPKAFHGRGAKIVNMGELFAHPRLRAVPMKRVELSGSESERSTLSEGDLLFARRSLVAEGAGKCSVVLDIDEPTTFESSIIRARPDSAKAKPLFLYYFFNSPAGLHCLDTIRRQVAVAGITGSDLSRLEIPIPPLPEQQAIAHILGTLDDKIELNRRMNETLEAMARALFKSWFVDFDAVRARAQGGDTGLPKPLADLFAARLVDSELGEIPEGWPIKRWGELVTLEYGKSLSGYDEESGAYPVYGTNGRIGRHSRPLCEHAGIIIGRKGAYRGVHFCGEPFFVIDTAFYVEPRVPVELRWAYYDLLLRQDINNMDSGSAERVNEFETAG